MREHDDLPYIVIERRGAGLTPFLWGALMGAAAALLLAPRSGAETQEEIRERVRRARTAAEDRIGAAREKVTLARERVEDQVESVRRKFDEVREQLDERTEQARDAVEHGRRVARDAREEIGRRVSEARENFQAGSPTPTGEEAERPGRSEIDVVVTDVTEERVEGSADLT